MKITKPAETVEVCDFCRCAGTLETCDVCGLEFCLSDQGHVPGSYGHHRICHDCCIRDDVQDICIRYGKGLMAIFRSRDAALKRLGKRVRSQQGDPA
jgi:hypothetical protein